jgi:hypothetical protein
MTAHNFVPPTQVKMPAKIEIQYAFDSISINFKHAKLILTEKHMFSEQIIKVKNNE